MHHTTIATLSPFLLILDDGLGQFPIEKVHVGVYLLLAVLMTPRLIGMYLWPPLAVPKPDPQVTDSIGAPGEIRTPGLLVRSQPLYPTELRAHKGEHRKKPGGEHPKVTTSSSAKPWPR